MRGEHSGVRTALRAGGPVILAVGVILTAIAVIDFFAAFGTFGPPPTRFWMAFLGLPLVAIGLAMVQAGYLGAASRYIAGEVTPALRDTVDALGLGDGVACPACGGTNDRTASFCSSCGAKLASVCGACGAGNDAAARYCTRCGTPLASP